jgi:hypothetical protein
MIMWGRKAKSIESLDYWNTYAKRATLIEEQKIEASSPEDEKTFQNMLEGLKIATKNGIASDKQPLERMQELKEASSAARIKLWGSDTVIPIKGQKSLVLAKVYAELYDDSRYLHITAQTWVQQAKVTIYQIAMQSTYANKAIDAKMQVENYGRKYAAHAKVADAAIAKMKSDEVAPAPDVKSAATAAP